MGFHPEAIKKAIYFTKNSGLDRATQWMMEHIIDSDFNDTFVPPGTNKAKFEINLNHLDTLVAMGFTSSHSERALKETNNNLEQAADWLFTNQLSVDEQMFSSSEQSAENESAPESSNTLRDGGDSKSFQDIY